MDLSAWCAVWQALLQKELEIDVLAPAREPDAGGIQNVSVFHVLGEQVREN
jgi:hypothetical protein